MAQELVTGPTPLKLIIVDICDVVTGTMKDGVIKKEHVQQRTIVCIYDAFPRYAPIQLSLN